MKKSKLGANIRTNIKGNIGDDIYWDTMENISDNIEDNIGDNIWAAGNIFLGTNDNNNEIKYNNITEIPLFKFKNMLFK